MGLRHLHYAFRKRRIGIFVPFQYFWRGQRALKCFMSFFMSNSDNTFLWYFTGLISHEIFFRSFSCFFARHLNTLLSQTVESPLLGGMNPRHLSTRSREMDMLNTGKEPGIVGRQNSYPLQSHSCFQYRHFMDKLQPVYGPSFDCFSGLLIWEL